MSRKTFCLICFVLVLSMALASTADAGLVGWWKFDGDYNDSSGNRHDGTVVGSPTFVEGRLGQALNLNATTTDQYVNCGTDLGFTTVGDGGSADGFTIAVWVNRSEGGDQKLCGNLSVTSWAEGEGFQFAIYNDRTELDMRDSTGRYFSRDVDAAAFTVLEQDTWYHIAFVFDDVANTLTEYINGEHTNTLTNVPTSLAASTNEFRIGTQTPSHASGRVFRGLLDDFRLYDSALNEEEVQAVMRGGGAAYPLASRPVPADGSLHPDTWVSLSWSAGDSAVSHDVYFGENPEDVNEGLGDTFRGNQTALFFVAGFPGFPYPDGLVPGTTYYWRIDEVNEADPNSPWKGDLWSFTVPPKKAYDASPTDGAFFVDPDVVLSWTSGHNAKMHTVYFGDNYDDVQNAAGGSAQVMTTFKPGPLELEKTYYWRVDEFDSATTYTGDVWSFKTAKAGGGLRADYYRGMDFDNLVLTRTDPQVNFNWGGGAPDESVSADSFSVRWTGEVQAAFTETYNFYTTTDGSVRMWVDGKKLIDYWTDHSIFLNSGTIDFVSGNVYSIVLEYGKNGGNAVMELRWSSPSTPTEFVPQAALSPPVKASSPSPANGATGVKHTPLLKWGAGDYAASHEVYFGTDADAVKTATSASPEYKGTKVVGDESYDPGKLPWATTYYWRVHEVNGVNPDSPWAGNLWTFTTGDFLVVDDFEDYDAGDNQIWYIWHDGLGYGIAGTADYYAGNGTGAAVGDETTASYTEETIVHGGIKSMPLAYDNNKQGYSKYSEVKKTLTDARDWTEEGVAELSLWFRGRPESVGSFVESPAGTYTMTAAGADIWNLADEFHYAYRMLTGVGSITAKVESVDNTDLWAKAGVMIRETLEPGSKFAAVYITPGNGCRFQARTDTGIAATSDSSVATTEQTAITAPYWVKLERDVAGNFRASYSSNGSTWRQMSWNPQNISMDSNIYIGLALTSHNTGAVCQAGFSNVTITGTIGPQWNSQDIGIASNDAEPMYVAVSNSSGEPVVMVHEDPAASQIDTWTEWIIPLQDLADKGLDLTNVDRIAIGLGTQGNMTIPGGSGKMYFDDIRLYQPREAAK